MRVLLGLFEAGLFPGMFKRYCCVGYANYYRQCLSHLDVL